MCDLFYFKFELVYSIFIFLKKSWRKLSKKKIQSRKFSYMSTSAQILHLALKIVHNVIKKMI